MARLPMVTRTIQTTRCTVLCMDISIGEGCNTEVTLPRTYKDDAHLLKAVKKVIDTDNLKAVHIVGHEVCETLYGMTEQDFIANAKVLPPRKDYTNDTDTNCTDDDENYYTEEG